MGASGGTHRGAGHSRAALQAGVCFLALVLLTTSVCAQDNKKDKVGRAIANFTMVVDEEDKVTRPPLTGNPQIDYLLDPNLPHELMGYDLSDYPFYKRSPKEGHNFTCDGRFDGFYASVLHKCQVYYNCLFSQRYDFLCANYTVFDQVNFICNYASEVDCDNSERFYNRNEELYQTTTTTTRAPQIIYVDRPRQRPRPRPRPIRPLKVTRRRPQPNRRRPRPPPAPQPTAAPPDYREVAGDNNQSPQYYDYYDNNDYYNDYYDYAYDAPLRAAAATTTTTTTTSRPLIRRRPNRPGSGLRGGGGGGGGRFRGGGGGRRRQRPGPGGGGRRRRIKTTTTTIAPVANQDYYDDYYYYDDATYDDKQNVKKDEQPARRPASQSVQKAPRRKPGQRRTPNFRRPPVTTEPPVETPAANQPATDQPADPLVDEQVETAQRNSAAQLHPETPVVEEPLANTRRQLSRRPNSPPRIFRPNNARSDVSEQDKSLLTSNVQRQEPTSDSLAPDDVGRRTPERRRRIQTPRRRPLIEITTEAENPTDDNTQSRSSAGSGFGGRRQ